MSLTPLDLGVEWLPSPSARKLVPEGCPRGPGDTWSSLPFVERGERLPPGMRQSLPGPSRWSVQTGPFLLRSSSASCSCWAHSPHRLPQTLHCCRGRLPHAVPRHILGLTSPLQSLLTFFSPFCPLATPPHARLPPPWAGLLPGLRSLRAISHPQNALLSSARHHGSSINLHGHVGQQHAQSIFWELGPGDPTPGPPLPLALPHRQPALAAVPAAPGPQPLFLPASARPSLFGSLLFLAPAWPALRPRQCGLLFLPSLPSLHLHTAKSYPPFPALPEGHLLLG